MRKWRHVTGTLFATLLVWLLFTWPLPRHFSEGIPSSSQNVEPGGVRMMIPGDHLQLLYHFQLVQDFLTGRAPWFHNVYEFNTGDDAERYLPGAYFAPFSLLYAALALALPPAAAWNLIGFLSIWVTFAASLAYGRRFTTVPLGAWFGALLSIGLPFRWVSLLGGSPAGFAMMWVPLAVLGLDGAVRTGRLRHGWLAAGSLLLLCWGDVQVFFFTALSLPLWALLAAVDADLLPALRWKTIRARSPALAVVAAGLVAAAVYRIIRHAHLAASDMAGGRSLGEVRGYSPSMAGFWQWAGKGVQGHVYLGLTVMLVLAGVLWIFVARHPDRREGPSKRAVAALALVAMFGVLVLALGMQGPWHGLGLRVARAIIPPYAMVRQTTKIFAVLPTLLALLGALAADRLLRGAHRYRRTRSATAVVVAVALLGIWEYNAQVRAAVCLLDPSQGAYAAVAHDVKDRAEVPRALVLPVWPGDAAEASVYQFYAQAYGIRMVNGYSPVVSREYIANVFHPLQGVNQGDLTDAQINLLASMGVRHLILHEDLFPEKVSPFPVTLTRDRLLGHARLTFLGRYGPVWAFRIEAAPRASPPDVRRLPVRFPTRQIRFERLGPPEHRVPDPSCAGGGRLTLPPEGPAVVAGPWRIAPTDDLGWLLRVRGAGALTVRTLWNNDPLGESSVAVASENWTWVTLPLPPLPAFGPIRAVFLASRGELEVDTGLLISGQWDPDMKPGELRTFEAADFFHAGHSERDRQSVVFRPERDPGRTVFYGPRLPLAAGRYHLEWAIHSDAPSGTPLGRIRVAPDGAGEEGWISVRAGEPAALEWDQPRNLPVTWFFHYARTAPLRMESLALRRLPAAHEGRPADAP